MLSACPFFIVPIIRIVIKNVSAKLNTVQYKLIKKTNPTITTDYTHPIWQ